MQKEKMLSIIIPVYNTEKYLRQCIDSLLTQRLTSYEIIIVNDGSTDNSGSIIEEYTQKFDFISSYEQKNAGQSVARNLGLSKATGEYIYFMDSDDYLVEDSLNVLLEDAVENDLDAIFFDGEAFLDYPVESDSSKKFNYDYRRIKSYGTYSHGELLMSNLLEDNSFFVSPCLFIVKSEVFEKNNLLFHEHMIYEDEIFTVQLFLTIQKCKHQNNIVFKRRVRQNSTVTSGNKQRSFDSYYKVLMNFEKIYTNHQFLSDDVKKVFVKKKMADIYKALIRLYYDVDGEQNKDMFRDIKLVGKNHHYFSLKSYFKSNLYPLHKRIRK